MPTKEQMDRRSAPRYAFLVTVEVSEVESRKRAAATAKDLSRFGCYLETPNASPVGTELRLQITHTGADFKALGTVVHSKANAGMGILFTYIDPNDQAILEQWLAELGKSPHS